MRIAFGFTTINEGAVISDVKSLSLLWYAVVMLCL